MPRRSRTVVAGFPHHVTQRGNRRERVFFSDADRRAYLDWLGQYAEAQRVDILAYCLMPNHVHLVAVPRTANGLHRTLKPLHMRYAQAVNRAHGWSGHLWQGRFFSSPLDSEYFVAAVRYVERNPLRAGLVERAEWYPWSSAAAHCGLRSDGLLPNDSPWARGLNEIRDWSAFLAHGDDERDRTLRRHADQGLPCGSDEFVERLEQITGRELRYRSPGGQKQTLRPG